MQIQILYIFSIKCTQNHKMENGVEKERCWKSTEHTKRRKGGWKEEEESRYSGKVPIS